MDKRKMKIRLVVLAGLLFLPGSLSVFAQSGKFYSPDEVLSNSLINQVYQDRKGFIWVATENGLNKFDGNKFTIYMHADGDSTSLKNNYVRTVFEDSAGNLWIGCLNGLMRYDWVSDSFREIKMYKEGKPINPHVTRIIESRSGEVWLSTSGQGVFSLKKEGPEFYPELRLSNLLNTIYLNLIFEDTKGNIWIGSDNEGLHCYNPLSQTLKSFTAPSEISGNNISSIAEDSQGNIFVGTLTRGLNKYNSQRQLFETIPYNANMQLLVKDLSLSQDNTLYIGTDGQGLKRYNALKNRVEDYEINAAPFDFSKGKVHSILQDRDRNLWLGIFQKGIIFIPSAEKKFEYFGFKSLKDNPIGSGTVMSIFKDRAGITWVGVDNEGMYGMNVQGERIAHYQQTASSASISNTILSIFEDSDNNLWVGSYTKGLAKLNRQTGFCEYIPELLNEKVFSITEDAAKNLLIGTYGSGFYKLNLKSRAFTHFESGKRENDDFSIDELSNDWINDILVDREGLIWLAHYKGVSCYNADKNTYINYLNQNTILPRTVVYALHEDRSGRIWIGSSDGLSVFDKKDNSIRSYTNKEGLSNNVICGICEDVQGNIWLSTYFGISKLVLAEQRFVNYYAGDGLQGNEFTRGANFTDRDGKIYFGGIYGITNFYPLDITDTQKELKIILTDFYIFDKAFKPEGEALHEVKALQLTHADNTLSLEFSALEYANHERIVYQYMMEELGRDWMSTYPGAYRISYTNLSPGHYTFKVRARDGDNYSEIKTLKISILPPWYLSSWAYAAYVLLSLLLLLLLTNYVYSKVLHRRREMLRRHQEQINEAKLQFFINISHEIRTPMTLIISPLEKLLSENKDQKLQKTYVMIHRNSQRILHLINQLMDVRKLDKGQMHLHFRETDMVGFIEDLMLPFEQLAQKKDIDFRFEHTDEKLPVWIDLNNFDKVLLNVLFNAFKYTPDNGQISIILSAGQDEHVKGPLKKYFEIVVADTGIGVDKDRIEQIFERFYQINNNMNNSNFGTGIGLHLSRSLVSLHHGIIFAENRTDGSGTRFIIRLPLGAAHLSAQEREGATEQKVQSPRLPVVSAEETLVSAEDTAKKAKPKTRFKVLIVDDEAEIREYIQEELASEYKTLLCENGKKALELALKELPDLIVSDVMMPEMDGITLSKKLKQNINVSHIPVVLLTAKAAPEHRIEGLDTGADAYIAKPFSTELLKTTIAGLIENRERLRTKFSGQQQPEDKMQKLEMQSPDEMLMERIMRVINENLSNPELSVEVLAAQVGMSRVHIHRKLKELTSQSAGDFIKGIRLKQAATLLSGKKMSISEVAYATGFSNLSHFSNSFREFYGCAPRDYAKNQPYREEG